MNPQADPIALLTGLLERYSPSGQEQAAAAYLVEEMNKLGYQAFVDEAGNAVGTLGAGPKEIMLLGHIDTVPGYIPVHQSGSTLWGRGSVDAKGPCACMVSAAARVTVPPGWKITVVGAVGEEHDSRGARYLRDRCKPDYLVIGEPSQWDRVTIGYKGDAYFHYSIGRPLMHTATQMESACEAAVVFWNHVRAHCNEWNTGKERIFDQLFPTLRSMASDSDGFTETATLYLAVRLPMGVEPQDMHQMLLPYLGDGKLDLLRGDPAYKADKNTDLVRAFLHAIRKNDGSPSFSVKTGTSDMNTVAPHWQCPTLAYGPGDSRLDHTPHEHIDTGEYLAGINVLADALQKLMEA
jgi:LysW-gamma-L-lysine carboxypeptidase